MCLQITTSCAAVVEKNPIPCKRLEVVRANDMSTSQNIHIHNHGLPASSGILDFLSSHLPYSIPLLRRLQFREEKFSNRAFLLATFPAPPAADPSQPVSEHSSVQLETRQPFAVGFFDRSSGPGIQAWMFSSLELPQEGSCDSDAERSDKADVEVEQVITMLGKFAELSPREAASNPAECQLSKGFTRGTDPSNGADSLEADILMIGSMHKRLRDCLSIHATRCLRDDLMGPGGPYTKYLISVPSLRSMECGQTIDQALPADNLQHCVVEPSDYPSVMANNAYIRSPKSLKALPNCGIRDTTTGKLAAFAFLGADGSLRTLHVEPEWRARGLGVLLAKNLLLGRNSDFTRDQQCGRDGKESGSIGRLEKLDLAHGDVAATNTASVRLFQKLGAVRAWEAFWVRLDLQRVVYHS